MPRSAQGYKQLDWATDWLTRPRLPQLPAFFYCLSCFFSSVSFPPLSSVNLFQSIVIAWKKNIASAHISLLAKSEKNIHEGGEGWGLGVWVCDGRERGEKNKSEINCLFKGSAESFCCGGDLSFISSLKSLQRLERQRTCQQTSIYKTEERRRRRRRVEAGGQRKGDGERDTVKRFRERQNEWGLGTWMGRNAL